MSIDSLKYTKYLYDNVLVNLSLCHYPSKFYITEDFRRERGREGGLMEGGRTYGGREGARGREDLWREGGLMEGGREDLWREGGRTYDSWFLFFQC